jgi:hypothetical protein
VTTQTWTDRERRMLEAIRDGEEAGDELELTMLADRVKLDHEDGERNLRLVKLTLGRLLRAGFIDGTVQGDGDDPMFLGLDFVLLERGLRQVAVWPSEDPYLALVDLLKAQLEAEPEPEQRSKLQALLAGVTTAGRDVVVSLTTAWMRQQMGLP